MRVVLAILLVLILAFIGYFVLNSPPTIKADRDLKAVGRATPFKLTLDHRRGLRQLRVWWEQSGKTILVQDVDLGKDKHREVQLTLGPSQQKGLADGQAKLVAEARDAGLVSKKLTASWDVVVQSRPPQLTVLTGQHYVNQGGCDMVVYSVSNSAVWSGIRVGQHLYPGFPMPGAEQPGTHFAIFAFPYNEPASTIPVAVARDAAGNEAVATFTYKLFPKTWRKREFQIDDAFLQKVVPPIMSRSTEIQDTGDLLKNFLAINGDLRRIDNELIRKMGPQTEQRFLWDEPFEQIGQWEAEFADHRLYFYKGQKVDEQDHLGIDLAQVQQTPVKAANRGKIIFADWLGIYGNAIMIDHGYGLHSLYGHMAAFSVKAGDAVDKGQVIGTSDSTGLAGGDHVHFSLLLNGDQITPIEWWDPHWLHDRLLVKFPNQKLPGAPVHGEPAPPPAAPPIR